MDIEHKKTFHHRNPEVQEWIVGRKNVVKVRRGGREMRPAEVSGPRMEGVVKTKTEGEEGGRDRWEKVELGNSGESNKKQRVEVEKGKKCPDKWKGKEKERKGEEKEEEEELPKAATKKGQSPNSSSGRKCLRRRDDGPNKTKLNKTKRKSRSVFARAGRKKASQISWSG